MNSPQGRIELRLRSLNQLFNSLDPSPFYEQDLDDNAEEFIVGWARELPRDAPLEIVIHITALPDDQGTLAETSDRVDQSVRRYFAYRQQQEQRRLSELWRIGRFSLVVGLLFLAVCFTVANLLGNDDAQPHAMLRLFRESLIIVGWVALWRPLEIFLYDWWPIARSRQLYKKLAAASVMLVQDTVSRSAR